jgi:hypothetical protein
VLLGLLGDDESVFAVAVQIELRKGLDVFLVQIERPVVVSPCPAELFLAHTGWTLLRRWVSRQEVSPCPTAPRLQIFCPLMVNTCEQVVPSSNTPVTLPEPVTFPDGKIVKL